MRLWWCACEASIGHGTGLPPGGAFDCLPPIYFKKINFWKRCLKSVKSFLSYGKGYRNFFLCSIKDDRLLSLDQICMYNYHHIFYLFILLSITNFTSKICSNIKTCYHITFTASLFLKLCQLSVDYFVSIPFILSQTESRSRKRNWFNRSSSIYSYTTTRCVRLISFIYHFT